MKEWRLRFPMNNEYDGETSKAGREVITINTTNTSIMNHVDIKTVRWMNKVLTELHTWRWRLRFTMNNGYDGDTSKTEREVNKLDEAHDQWVS